MTSPLIHANNEVKMSIYYKDAQKKLHLIVTWAEASKESIKDVQQAVLEQLHNQMEHYLKPILIMIPGGKA